MISKILLGLAALISVALTEPPARAEDFQVAVASNFAAPARQIAAAFAAESGHRAILSFGGTGAFYSQIKNGAPFELLLAADAKTPARLEREGLAQAGSRFCYAQGLLALWSSQDDLVDPEGKILKDGSFKYLAAADPRLAPYGAAALELLTALKLTDSLQGRLVTGQNIGQSFQFVESGQAELGLIAWSQVCRDGRLSRGSAWLPPAELYQPIIQEAVLMQNAGEPARAFAEFLRHSPQARAIIKSFGYKVPSGL